MVMISKQLKTVVQRELKLQNIEITEEMTADQVPGWDSIAHLQIIAAIEQEFHVKFRSTEVMRLKRIGDLQALVDRKTNETK